MNKLEVLHFAPERFFYDKFSNCSNVNYFPVDFNPKFKGIRDVVDIQKIQYENEKFDIIICIHVLEHIPDDNTAMKELLRVLKKSGTAYIMDSLTMLGDMAWILNND
ncbi:MAG: class I SAM-dependent methyltransferase [Endomicrobium sp.]|nr:class I SAM-dependent methyltransferase [Endomicrobium sp.]